MAPEHWLIFVVNDWNVIDFFDYLVIDEIPTLEVVPELLLVVKPFRTFQISAFELK